MERMLNWRTGKCKSRLWRLYLRPLTRWTWLKSTMWSKSMEIGSEGPWNGLLLFWDLIIMPRTWGSWHRQSTPTWISSWSWSLILMLTRLRPIRTKTRWARRRSKPWSKYQRRKTRMERVQRAMGLITTLQKTKQGVQWAMLLSRRLRSPGWRAPRPNQVRCKKELRSRWTSLLDWHVRWIKLLSIWISFAGTPLRVTWLRSNRDNSKGGRPPKGTAPAWTSPLWAPPNLCWTTPNLPPSSPQRRARSDNSRRRLKKYSKKCASPWRSTNAIIFQL